MQIIGIGTDLVSISRIRNLWERYSFNFARRILTPTELEDLNGIRKPVPFLAKRYAAKEAVAKALGTGFRPEGLLLSEIGVRNDELGRPHLAFFGRTAEEILKRKVVDSQISLSDEREYALAFVVLIGN
jgi:holo-[acyl-carrier protein] synthase